MKTALVIHPWFPIFGGGEYLCLCVCDVLQKEGYDVSLLSDTYQPDIAEELYSMGNVLNKCKHIPVPGFFPKKKIPKLNLYAVQKILWARKVQNKIKDLSADVIFATQPSWFKFKQEKRYDFMYNVRDLYTYPTLTVKLSPKSLAEKHKQGIGLQWKAYYFLLTRMRDILIGHPRVKKFLALSDIIYKDLIHNGIANAEMVFPPARLDIFQPKTKKRQIVITCRIDPAKNLELFFKIAEQLPEEKFILVSRDNQTTRLAHPRYAEKLFKKQPGNVEFVNSPIKNVPELLEESLVYLYTGIEPGIGIAIMEACGAGCIPMAPHIGGGSEIINALGAGETFNSYPNAVRKLKDILENPEPSPMEIRKMAIDAFGVERFQSRIKELLQ